MHSAMCHMPQTYIVDVSLPYELPLKLLVYLTVNYQP